MTDDTDDILSKLPARLKEARHAQGLSLESVASLSGVSRSMVSQIERGESSPTIATLWNLTRALNVDFAALLDSGAQQEQIAVLRATDVPVINTLGQKCRIRILSAPKDAGRNEIYEVLFDQGGRLSSQPHARGACEVLTVLDGTINVDSGEVSDTLQAGDTARYSADVPHCLSSTGGPARAFLVVTYS